MKRKERGRMVSGDESNNDDRRSIKRKERSREESDNDRDNVESVKFKWYNKLDDMNDDLKKALRVSESS
jgi:hypothetical protein